MLDIHNFVVVGRWTTQQQTVSQSLDDTAEAAVDIAIARAKSACHASSISLSISVKCSFLRKLSMEDLHSGHVLFLVFRRPSRHSECISWSQLGSLVRSSFLLSPQFNAQGQIDICRSVCACSCVGSFAATPSPSPSPSTCFRCFC